MLIPSLSPAGPFSYFHSPKRFSVLDIRLEYSPCQVNDNLMYIVSDWKMEEEKMSDYIFQSTLYYLKLDTIPEHFF